MGATLDATRADMMRALEARSLAQQLGEREEKQKILLTRMAARIPESRAEEFRERLNELQKEFDDADKKDGDDAAEPKQLYALTLAFYPTIYFPEDQTESGS